MATVQKILDSELPSPTFTLLPGLAKPLPSDVTFTRPDVDDPDPTARTLDPRKSKLVAKGADTPRIIGNEQDLLLETGSRTNQVDHSSAVNAANWGTSDLDPESEVTSVFEGEKAYEQFDDPNTAGAGYLKKFSGTLTGSDEVFHVVIEKGTADLIAFQVRNGAAGAVMEVAYDWTTDTFTTQFGSVAGEHSREFPFKGPNGGKLIHLVFRYAGSNDDNINGDGRVVWLYPDEDGSGGSTIYHNIQLEEAPTHSFPFATNASATTRGGDSLKLFDGSQPDWWNPNQGTFFVEFTDRRYNTQKATILDSGTNNQYIVFTDGGNIISKDGTNIANPTQGATPFERQKVAVSFNDSEMRIAVDGTVDSKPHTGTYPQATTIRVDVFEALQASIGKMRYSPVFLPPSEADRSAGDPVSLETLTS